MPIPASNARVRTTRARNQAILSILGVIGGGWLLFRAQSPNKTDIVVSARDEKTMAGKTGEDKTARMPSSEDRTKP
ncbi:uncharacterized protein N7515_006740 [Penicillium bovifimosum]|uniref:Uncharacterized protein n=1 Tax=Penicillium bovifimosum TaxID=126998 RepID=A0A9W9L121_9EURO|nr:uncharacterized protein N7515_006740 [Penicillium bovifimosum]KAJ5130701.1 hypothetical protein N7515_006740 [Penicillium bovifimosum]